MNDQTPSRVLHAIVGYKLAEYFTNAVRSALVLAPDDDVLIVDNASKSPELTEQLRAIAEAEPHAHLMEIGSNDQSRNAKVGGLYYAYNEVFSYALEHHYDFVHLVQGDMQLLWWDPSVMEMARELYEHHPECVNIRTIALPQYERLSDGLEEIGPRLLRFRHYGVTDTGLYHLGRWRAQGMSFSDSERAHARKYLEQGIRALSHPLPTVSAIPWPAVVRKGEVRGSEVRRRREFLLRPLTAREIADIKGSEDLVWMEDVCIPWGWTCLTPFWPTGLESLDYWMYRYRDVRSRGLLASWPRWDRRGLEKDASPSRGAERRPRAWFWQIAVLPPWHTLRKRVGAG